MDVFTFILLVIILCAIIFLVYYFFQGQKGDISISSPVESRVDEYLDRRFESMVQEWGLVSHSRLKKFTDGQDPAILQEEARIAELKSSQAGVQTTLSSLEARIDALEKELAGKSAKK